MPRRPATHLALNREHPEFRATVRRNGSIRIGDRGPWPATADPRARGTLLRVLSAEAETNDAPMRLHLEIEMHFKLERASSRGSSAKKEPAELRPPAACVQRLHRRHAAGRKLQAT